eukprot:Seg2303.3 transcript_id=Seg2303.3/GoldUCD/mRNA.D3Y31 product="hypothetical protein" protein_id=Seg2303.3/GoldUCD/D3Y31
MGKEAQRVWTGKKSSDREATCKRPRMASNKQTWRERKKAESSESEEENNTDADGNFKVVSRKKDRQKNVFRPVEQPKAQPGHGKYDHPIFKEISKANKAVNDMTVKDITRQLAAFGMESRYKYYISDFIKVIDNICKEQESYCLLIYDELSFQQFGTLSQMGNVAQSSPDSILCHVQGRSSTRNF